MAISESRLNTIKRIEQLEQEGKFDVDAWENPPFTPIKPGEVDYFHKKLSTRIKAKFCSRAVEKFIKKEEKKKSGMIKEIIGAEKLESLTSGAVITSNHFHPFDSYPITRMLKKLKNKKKLHIVIAEHNYAGAKGFYGYVFKNYNTIPLAQNREVMIECFKAINHYLTIGDLVLIYPEQAMWLNYKKPRPLKEGAFRFAAKANVPVVACFVTMTDSQYLDNDGAPVQEYTLHVIDVIYPKPELSYKEIKHFVSRIKNN